MFGHPSQMRAASYAVMQLEVGNKRRDCCRSSWGPTPTPHQMAPISSRSAARRDGKVVMYSSVSVDGFVADENDQPGPLFDWLSSGDVPLDESGG